MQSVIDKRQYHVRVYEDQLTSKHSLLSMVCIHNIPKQWHYWLPPWWCTLPALYLCPSCSIMCWFCTYANFLINGIFYKHFHSFGDHTCIYTECDGFRRLIWWRLVLFPLNYRDYILYRWCTRYLAQGGWVIRPGSEVTHQLIPANIICWGGLMMMVADDLAPRGSEPPAITMLWWVCYMNHIVQT